MTESFKFALYICACFYLPMFICVRHEHIVEEAKEEEARKQESIELREQVVKGREIKRQQKIARKEHRNNLFRIILQQCKL